MGEIDDGATPLQPQLQCRLTHGPGVTCSPRRAALLACAISAWLQELSGIDRGIDRGNGRGRRTITRLRHELINIPARITHHGRTTVLRPPPGPNLLAIVLPRLQALPSG